MSRAMVSRTLDDHNGHTSTWNYHWGTVVNGVISNTVTDPLSNDTVHVFTAQEGVGTCGFYETQTRSYQGTGGSRRLLKQVDTSYSKSVFNIETISGSGLGNVVPTSIQTTVYPSGKVSLVEKTYAPPAVTGGPISGDVATERYMTGASRGKTNRARCSGKPIRFINGRRTARISPPVCSICRLRWW